MGKQQPFNIKLPKMSWDVPIEQEILAFVRYMKQRWAAHRSIWPSVNREAQIYVSAYQTVENHIVREMAFREKMSKQQKTTAPQDKGEDIL
jgi:hypothetical protein